MGKLIAGQDPSELSGEDSSIEEDTTLDGVAVLSQIVNSRMFAVMTARHAAVNEYMTEAERDARRTASLENLQDAGIPTNSLEKVAQESVNKDRSYEQLLDRVFAKLLIVAETEGLEAALKPETRNQIIRSMVSREEYMQMLLATLEHIGEVINGLQDAGRLGGGDAGKAIESLGAAMSNNGQLERLESGAIRDIALDARSIFGSQAPPP